MARWTPQNNQLVKQNEHVGRRLFDEPALVGANDQKPTARLDLRHFLEKRDGLVSLDLLGKTSIEKGIVRYLRPRADRAGERFRPPKAFHGWAVLTARKFGSPPAQAGFALSVIASPESGGEMDENIYHAHIAIPEDMHYYTMALHLRELFETHGTIERALEPARPVKPKHRLLGFLPAKFRKWLTDRLTD